MFHGLMLSQDETEMRGWSQACDNELPATLSALIGYQDMPRYQSLSTSSISQEQHTDILVMGILATSFDFPSGNIHSNKVALQ